MSTSAFFALPKTLRRLHEGPLGAHIDACATRLLEQGFSLERARDKIRFIADLSGWLRRHRLGACDVDAQTLRRFVQDRKRYIRPGRGADSTLQILLDVLSERGIVSMERSPEAPHPCAPAEHNFKRYLS